MVELTRTWGSGSVCVGGGGREKERERNNKHNYDIRLSIYSDGMGPVEVERRIRKTSVPYIFDFTIKLICDTLH